MHESKENCNAMTTRTPIGL